MSAFDAQSSDSGPSSNDLAATFAIEGMTCGACVAAITNTLEATQGISDVAVSLITERGSVTFDPLVLSADDIKEKIEDCGFDVRILRCDAVSQPITASQAEEHNDESKPQRSARTETLHIKVFGMTCSACSISIENALRSVPGVESAVVALTIEEARIVYDPTVVGPRSLIEAVENAGFDAILSETADNSAQIEALTKVKEIKQYRKDSIMCFFLSIPIMITMPMMAHTLHLTDILCIRIIGSLYLNDLINFCLVTPIQFIYGKRFVVRAYSAFKHKALNMDVLVAISTSSAYSFSVLSWLYTVTFIHDGTRPATLWETSAMVILFVTFGKYLESKAKGQTSVALSRLISLVPSVSTIYEDAEKYATVYNIDELVQKRSAEAEAAASRDDDDVNNDDDNDILVEKTVPTELIQERDIVILRPGEKVPADGVVLRGVSYVSEALISGESYPIRKGPGDLVIGGSVNGSGKLDFKVLKAGKDTKLAHIVKLVQDAQTTRAPVQRVADIMAGYFVPLVLSLAMITLCVWVVLVNVLKDPPMMFKNSEGSFMVCLRVCISVIVVACPCALGLATPTAVMVATGVGADNGILIKGGAVLEMASHVDTIVFDKTGTLTVGRCLVSKYNFENLMSWTKQDIWRILQVVESFSEHPIARGIIARAMEDTNDDLAGVSCVSFSAEIGKGATGQVAFPGYDKPLTVVIGKRSLLEEKGVPISSDGEAEVDSLLTSGESLVFIAVNGTYVGWVSLNDSIKPEARVAIESIQQLGIEVAMLTGDTLSVAKRVAKELGISEKMVWADVTPAGKIEIVKMLQGTDEDDHSFGIVDEEELLGSPKVSMKHKKCVAMVGDGINDSPALVAAELGISLTGSTDAAIEAADIVLIRENEPLLDIANAIDLSRTAFRRIKMNLVWAMVYNIVMVPIAMGLFIPLGFFLHPMMASAAMAMSSVSVLVSSLMLARWKPLESTGRMSESLIKPSTGFLDKLKGIKGFFRQSRSNTAYLPVNQGM